MRFILSISVMFTSIFALGQDREHFEVVFNRDWHTVSSMRVIMMDSISYQLDSITFGQIHSRMIKQVEVIRNGIDNSLSENQERVIQIFPKKRFEKRILLLLAKNSGLAPNTSINKQIKNREFVIKTGVGFDNYNIETTSLLKIVIDFGLNYDLIKHDKGSILEFRYKKVGLSFYFYELRGDALLNCIVFNSPFRGVTDTGVKLGNSTMLDVKQRYGALEWYTTNSANYWWSECPGVEFGVERDLSLPRYPLNEELHEMKKVVEIIILRSDES